MQVLGFFLVLSGCFVVVVLVVGFFFLFCFCVWFGVFFFVCFAVVLFGVRVFWLGYWSFFVTGKNFQWEKKTSTLFGIDRKERHTALLGFLSF